MASSGGGGGGKTPGSGGGGGGGGGSGSSKAVAVAAKPVARIGVLTYYREQNIDILTEIRGFLPQDAKESAARRHSPELVTLTRAVGRQLYDRHKAEVAILNDPERCETWQGLELLMRDVRADPRATKPQQQRGKAAIEIEEITDENATSAAAVVADGGSVGGGDDDGKEDVGWERLTIRERLQPLTELVAAAAELEQKVAERVPARPITEKDTAELVRLADACCRTLRHARLLRFGDVMRLTAPAQRERLVDSVAMFYKFARVVALTPPLYDKCCAALGALDRLLQTAQTSIKQLTRNVFALMPILIARFTTDPHWQAVVHEHVSSLGTGILTSIVDVFGIELGNRQLEAVFDRARDPHTGSISVERLMATGQTLYRLEGDDDDDDEVDAQGGDDDYEGEFEDDEGDYYDGDDVGGYDVEGDAGNERDDDGGIAIARKPEVARPRGALPQLPPLSSRAPTASGVGRGGDEARGGGGGGGGGEVRSAPLGSVPSSRPPPAAAAGPRSAAKSAPSASASPSVSAPRPSAAPPASSSSAPSPAKGAAKKSAAPVAVAPVSAKTAAPRAAARGDGGQAPQPTAAATMGAQTFKTPTPATAASAPSNPSPGSDSRGGVRGDGGRGHSAPAVTAHPAPKSAAATAAATSATTLARNPEQRASSQSTSKSAPPPVPIAATVRSSTATAARTSSSVGKTATAVVAISAPSAALGSSSSSSESATLGSKFAESAAPVAKPTQKLAPSGTQPSEPPTVALLPSPDAKVASGPADPLAAAAAAAVSATTEAEIIRRMQSLSPQQLAALFKQVEATRTPALETQRRPEEVENAKDAPDGRPSVSENPETIGTPVVAPTAN